LYNGGRLSVPARPKKVRPIAFAATVLTQTRVPTAGVAVCCAAVNAPQLSFFQRFAIAVQVFFRAIGDAEFAQRARLDAGSTPPSAAPEPPQLPIAASRDARPALQLLSVLQREGRLVDFIQQDIAAYSDADVGAAARVVHDGCRRGLQGVLKFSPIMREAEGSVVAIEAGYDAHAIRLTGNVGGGPTFRGKLKHKGWRATDLKLPEVIDDNDCAVIAPAEVEL
jgi:hypothetical protein